MKETIGLITVVLSIIGHAPYIIDTYKKKTKPHVFTWIIWSLVVGIAFLGQWSRGGGAGAWSTGITAIIVIIIAILAFRNRNTEITSSDKLFFVAAILALVPWYLTKDPTISVIMATVIDGCAFIPTIRKTLKQPESETFSTYALNILRHSLSLLALASYNLATILYPAYLLMMNSIITIIIILGRKKLEQSKRDSS